VSIQRNHFVVNSDKQLIHVFLCGLLERKLAIDKGVNVFKKEGNVMNKPLDRHALFGVCICNVSHVHQHTWPALDHPAPITLLC
jgi:hypothetical protein